MNLSSEEISARSDALYSARENLDGVRASVALLSLNERADDYESLWRLGRAHFFLGQEAVSEDESRAHHTSAVSVCARAVRLRPERVEGNFWLGVNLALLARLERNPLKALGRALRAKKSLERAARLDAVYHAAGPLRVLARLEHKLPRLFGGGLARARADFERAIRLAPANTVTRLYFAELLHETGDTAQAREQLEAILNTQPDPAWAFEQARDRELARNLLDRMRQTRR